MPSLTIIQQESCNTQYYITYRDKICFYALPDGKVDIGNPFWSSYVKLQLGAFIKAK